MSHASPLAAWTKCEPALLLGRVKTSWVRPAGNCVQEIETGIINELHADGIRIWDMLRYGNTTGGLTLTFKFIAPVTFCRTTITCKSFLFYFSYIIHLLSVLYENLIYCGVSVMMPCTIFGSVPQTDGGDVPERSAVALRNGGQEAESNHCPRFSVAFPSCAWRNT